MKTTLSTGQVMDTLLDHEVLGQRTDAGIIKATEALTNWLEDLEEDTGTEMELDPIALRCEFNLVTLNEAAEMYDINTSGASEGEDRDYLIIQYLRNYTTVIEIDENTVIVGEF